MYADYDYYMTDFLTGKEPTIPEKDFPYWEKQAGRELNNRTFGRLQRDSKLITEEVKDCVCAMAELLYRADSISEASVNEGAAGPLASYSNDGVSATYDLGQSIYTETGKRKELDRLAVHYLLHTGLLYAGVPCHGCCD